MNERRGESRNELDETRRHQRQSYLAETQVEAWKRDVGAWRRIGGGQGALSQAYKETGVACIPGKQPDYSGLSERKQCGEAHIKALEP